MPQTKQEKPFGERLKAWFRSNKSSFTRPQDIELHLSSETVQELGTDQPVQSRIQTLKELQDLVKERRLQQHGVELLWVKVSDLLDPKHEKEVRHAVLDFVRDLVAGQYTTLDIMRAEIFRFLKKHTIEEDLNHRIKLLLALTEDGKDILHFEEEMGSMLISLLKTCTEKLTDCTDILCLTVNLVKFNSAYLDPDIVSSLIRVLSDHACRTTRDKEIQSSLEIFKCIVMYNFVPSEALLQFVSCLCRVVNLPEVCQDSWNTMRSLIGTHLGHSALFNLCVLIQSSPELVDVALVRGAVFFIGHCLWGPNHVPTLKYSAMTVLPVFLVALQEAHPLVVFEMSIQMESLVTRQGTFLNAPGWEEAITVLQTLIKKLEVCDASLRPSVETHIQNTVVTLETLAENKKYPGSRSRLYDLVESVAHLCPEQIVIHLLNHRSEYLYPAKEGWIENLGQLMDRFYERDVRQQVRMKMLSILLDTVTKNILMYEEKLLEVAVLPFLSNLDSEIDRMVKVKGVQTISGMAVVSTGSHLKDLLDILEKILKKIGDSAYSQDTAVLYNRQDFLHYHEAILGLINIFRKKFYHPPVSSVRRCYDILVTVLDQLYKNTNTLEFTGEIRLEIFRCFLRLRARHDYHMGVISDCEETVVFSPYVICESRHPGKHPSTSGQLASTSEKGLVTLSLTRACRLVIRCLKEERDWRVLSLVLAEVPNVLQNKGMLVRYEESISLLAGSLCALVQTNSKLPDINVPTRFGRADFNMAVYPVLAALASYNRWLDMDTQKKLIKSLEYGLLSKDCNKVCTVALTACILEMSSSMNTFLPEVLLNLSKISATVHIAIPVLEFLSTLISLPKVFASFNNDQYMSVFAITLPYTNPFKFNHYTVSLAHHVIIMWFLKCRLGSRKDFVKFIVKGLEGNVLQPFEEGNFRKHELASMNQDSSNRTRSSSLKEESRPIRARHMTGVTARPQLKRSGPDERQALHTFHQELTETCSDIMSRYSFANPSVQPERSALSSFLLKSGNSASWLLGTSIITISVSGCGLNSNRNGFCDSCQQICNPSESTQEQVSAKKRHVSEQSVRTTPVMKLASLSQDDLGVREKTGGLMLLKAESEAGKGDQDLRNTLENLNKEGRLCSCWCQGWCEVLVRRPAGEVSWMCRLQNGQLTNGPDETALTDITAMLMEDVKVKHSNDTVRLKVQRSNSDPEILEKISELDLARMRSIRQSCDPIPEEDTALKPNALNLVSHSRRPRSNTIDSTSPIKGSRRLDATLPIFKQERNNVISPQFMFLQLYQAAGLSTSYTEKPLVIPKLKQFDNSLKILDMIPCQETHKVGVLYVGLGQTDNEREILSNRYGSARYATFLNGLGNLIDLSEVNTSRVFLGGLSYKDGDGEFAYIWQEDAMQVVYHTATLMPNRETDPQFNKKKRHIGNDYVAIVYNESGKPYKMGTVKGQFIYATVVVEPLDFQSNRISVLAKPELSEFLSHLYSGKVVSDHNLSMLVRQIALHCNLAANIYSNIEKKADPYASNWLERLRHIKRLRTKLLKEKEGEEEDMQHDFLGYCLNKF